MLTIICRQIDLLASDVIEDFLHLVACEGYPPKQHLVENSSQRPHIQGKGVPLLLDDFGAEVIDGAYKGVDSFAHLVVFLIFLLEVSGS